MLSETSDPFINLLLQDRFAIVRCHAIGESGLFYIAQDMFNSNAEVLVKISRSLEMNQKEYRILRDLNCIPDGQDCPHVYVGGEFIVKTSPYSSVIVDPDTDHAPAAQSLVKQRHSFTVMELLGKSLHHHMASQEGRTFSLNTVCHIGIKVLQIFEKLHSLGKIYNDLKLNNILIGDQGGTPESLSSIKMIDFGLCSDYLGPNGNHIKEDRRKDFLGNMAFSSKYAMNFCQTSRRDDLISLSYMLIYLFRGTIDFL